MRATFFCQPIQHDGAGDDAVVHSGVFVRKREIVVELPDDFLRLCIMDGALLPLSLALAYTVCSIVSGTPESLTFSATVHFLLATTLEGFPDIGRASSGASPAALRNSSL